MKCIQCFHEIGSAPRCSLCGADQLADRKKRTSCSGLPAGTLLHGPRGSYELGRILGAGGFGITYLARGSEYSRPLAVKEFFPSELCRRDEWGRVCPQRSPEAFQRSVDHFCREAEILRKLDDCPNVANVEGVLLANNTSYLVMEYIQGPSLREMQLRAGGRLPYQQARALLLQIADALRQVHDAGLVHSDISPSNILLENGVHVKLIDFGAARSLMQSQDNSLTVQVKPGFSPPEQYAGSKLPMGPWTDLYALAGTFLRMITGTTPPPATERRGGAALKSPRSWAPEMPEAEEQAVLRAMELDYRLRPQSVDEFLRDFSGVKTDLDPPQEGEGRPQERWIDWKRFLRRPPQVPQPVLEQLRNGQVATRIELKPGRIYRVGRGSGQCDLAFPDEPTISRVHLLLRYIPETHQILVEDKSLNGTRLGDGRLLRQSSLTLSQSCLISLAEGKIMLRINMNNKQEDCK